VPAGSGEVRVIPVPGIPEVRPGDDLARLILRACADAGLGPCAGDVLAVTHKVVSKAEGRVVDLGDITPSDLAVRFAAESGKDPRHVEVVLRESRRIVRMDRGILIAETRHGFVCANAGVDASNVPGAETVCLLPEDPDGSARRLRERVREATGADVAVVITDSFGRAWRWGIANVAIGVAGISPLADYRGRPDQWGREMATSILAVGDELAAASELVMGKTDARPVAIIRGYQYEPADGSARELVMPAEKDMFR
jgi:coenzyme F420-0:L-glutamate ligase/coenzyme F420-1:gamma-L-glutamate ligase